MHKQILSSTLIYFSMIVLQALIQIILLPFQTHYLTPNQFGILATVIAVATLLAPIFNIGLQGAAQRFSSDYQNNHERLATLWTSLLWISLIAGVVIGIVLYFLTVILSAQQFSADINFTTLTTVMTHAIGMGMVLMFSEILRMIHQPYRYAFALTIMSLSYCVLNLVFIGLLGMGLNGALLAFSIMPIIGCLSFIITNPNKIHWSYDSSFIREVINYSIKVLPYFTFTTLNTVADRLLIVLILGKYYAGIYTVGATTASAMLMLVNAISFSVRPHIYAKFTEYTTAAFQAVRQLSFLSTIVIAFAGANIILWAPEIIKLLTSNAYHDAWKITALLTVKFMIQGISLFVVCSILFNKKKVHGLAWISVISLSLLILLSIQLAPHFGIWSVAIAGLIASLCELILNTVISKKTFQMKWPIVRMLSIMLVYLLPAIGLLAIISSTDWPLSMTILSKGLFSATSLTCSILVVSNQVKIDYYSIMRFIVPRVDA